MQIPGKILISAGFSSAFWVQLDCVGGDLCSCHRTVDVRRSYGSISSISSDGYPSLKRWRYCGESTHSLERERERS